MIKYLCPTRVIAIAVLTLLGSALAIGQNISSLTVSPNPVMGGSTALGTIKLTKSAGKSGLEVKLSSSETAASVPPSVTVASGATSVTFNVIAAPITATTKATIKGVDPSGKSADQVFTVEVPTVRLTALSLSPATVTASSSCTGTVTLSSDAPTGGYLVNLSSKGASITLPSSLIVASGAKTATFTIATQPVPANSTATISAVDLDGYSASAKLAIDVPAVRLTGISFAASSVTAANPATGTVTLSASAPAGGLNVSLSTAQPFVTIPGSVSVKAGAKTATFIVVTKPVTTAGTAAISGSDPNGYTASANLTVNIPAVRLTGVTLSPTSVVGGSTSTGTVTLSAAAPTAGFVVNLSTMQGFVSVPLTVTVKAGSTNASFTVSTGAVVSASTASIAAADFNEYRASASLTVNPQTSGNSVSMTVTYTFSPQSITVPAGSVVTWTNTGDFMAHTVTPDLPTPGMNSNVQYPNSIPPGLSFSWTVPATAKSGTAYYYHCIIHGTAGNGTSLGGGMAGVVIVK